MAKKNVQNEVIVENISTESLDSLMTDRYAKYAKYVIQERAIPDVRDGLKPVQRRIIYSMYRSGYTSNKKTVKCAKVVGDVMGNLHPHGDAAIYDALVRLSQNWKMSIPLVDIQGNNGSIDNDPAAASRYTETRLSELSELLVTDLNKNTVDMALNYDDTDVEPTVLPSRFPNLYVNGSDGIAVAIATDIPPHNLDEMCEAVIYRINHPRCDLEELLEIVKGPDFPTGGIIYKSSGIYDIYASGKGRIEVASRVEKVFEKDHYNFIVTEIPFGVEKKGLVFSIDKIRKAREVHGIVDVKDLSSGDDIKIVIELDKDVSNPDVVLRYLMDKTQLKVYYTSNITAICDNHPRTLTLTSYLDLYIQHQKNVISRRSKFDLDKTNSRLHILEGLIKAVSVVDEVIKIIRNSKDKADSKKNLMDKFGFTEEQAEAIVMMRLYKLSNTDVKVYYDEKAELDKLAAELTAVLSDENKLKKIIVNDLKDIIKKYPTPRKTSIEEKGEETQINKRDLVAKEDVYCVVTRDGYVKRSSLKSVKSSNFSLPGLKAGDSIVLSQVVTTLDYILAFTNKGNYLFIPVHEVMEGKWKDEGKHINYMCNLPLDESIVKCIVVKNFDKNVCIALVSKKGQIKKSHLSLFPVSRYNKPITAMRLAKDDEVVDVSVLNGLSNIMVLTKAGYASYFNENQISSSGLRTSGVKAISTLRGSEVGALISFRKDEKDKLLIVTDGGMYRIYDSSYLEQTDRLGRSQIIFKSFKSDVHNLAYITKIVKKNEPYNLSCLMSDNSIYEESLDDFHLTPVDKMCRKNLNFNDKLKIKYVFINDVQVIDDKTVEERGKVREKIEGEDDDSNNGGASFEQPLLDESLRTSVEAPQVEEVKPLVSKKTTDRFTNLKSQTETKKKSKLNLNELNNSKHNHDDSYEQISIFDDFGD